MTDTGITIIRDKFSLTSMGSLHFHFPSSISEADVASQLHWYLLHPAHPLSLLPLSPGTAQMTRGHSRCNFTLMLARPVYLHSPSCHWPTSHTPPQQLVVTGCAQLPSLPVEALPLLLKS